MIRRQSSGGARRWAGGLALVALSTSLLLSSAGLAAEGPGRKASGRRPATPVPGGAASVSTAAPAAGSSPAASSSGGARRGRGGKLLRGVANLNQADQAVLELLPGIGEPKAIPVRIVRAISC